jgi:hypothetical protein
MNRKLRETTEHTDKHGRRIPRNSVLSVVDSSRETTKNTKGHEKDLSRNFTPFVVDSSMAQENSHD